ncbi:pyridoxal phosphate-dependent aminotransferase [Ferrovibrio sp.]|uniref:pyridoxal phosphate-dependent aminotransferase n=1 Tax=Ferrovibrio sp. TaxID=1917215 RepID=UPI000CBDEC70|nr:pyridoxal phosphate-dependent aminotransferase [Ferrovibrio sp.]PJI40893.1 MAG: aspartate aminotransferase [Ferrovibrio sp.]
MLTIEKKFEALATENAPGQEVRQAAGNIDNLVRGKPLTGTPVDFSHGDVDAFTPTPGSFEAFSDAVDTGGRQAYTEYRGAADIRADLAQKLAGFTGAPVAGDGMILTAGTQGALFLSVAATVTTGDRVAIVQPDYFANRKLVQFFGGEVVPVQIDYMKSEDNAGLNLDQLRDAFASGVKVFLFSNPNNPTGAVYSAAEIAAIAKLAAEFDVMVIADQLYSRLRYSGVTYTHIRAAGLPDNRVITIMGPSKTESLSGYRLGVAFGASSAIDRMEKLQAIVTLRAAGYNQAVFKTWFSEPVGWMDHRIQQHQDIRDDLIKVFRGAGLRVRTPQAGSYLFPELRPLDVSLNDFVRLLRLQAGVTVTPGSEFGPHWSSLRLNFSQDHAAAVAASKRIVEMAGRYQR